MECWKVKVLKRPDVSSKWNYSPTSTILYNLQDRCKLGKRGWMQEM